VTTPILRVSGLTKRFGGLTAVSDVSFDVHEGEIFAIIGPNGAGKTTTLNLVSGLLTPTGGSVTLDGADVTRLPTYERCHRGLGRAFQVVQPFPEMTVAENVLVGAQFGSRGVSGAEARRRAETALREVGMESTMRRSMGTYSLGMRQRTKLAQAFAHDPSLLILDEPFNGLDPIGRHEMTEVLRRWVRSGRSLILASHILHEVEAVSPSFLLIRGGRVLASGPPDEIRALLADVPNEIRIRCNRPRLLACEFVESGLSESIRFLDQGETILVSTRSPVAVFEQLPHWLAKFDLEVFEMRSADDSLQRLFSSLMRIHRGEA